MLYLNTGDRIKQRRLELGFTADELAAKIGKSRATIYRYENGDIENMPTPILEPLAIALETTPADLMGWKKTENHSFDKNITQETCNNSNKNIYELHGEKEELVTVYEQLTSTNQDKVITYSKNLLVAQQMEEEATAQAAHERTDIEVTDEMKKHDDDIMDDDDF